MEESLLYVLHAVLRSAAQIDSLLRAARQAHPKTGSCTLLLLCDLPDAGAAVLPKEGPMLRNLQSGVMVMNARSSGKFCLLVRSRVWNDMQRAYLGENQPISYRHVVAQLLSQGKTDVLFDAATVSPASLKGSFSHILFSDISLSCTPDTPSRMMEALHASRSGCVFACVKEPKTFPRTAFSRLCTHVPFSLSPFLQVKAVRFQQKGSCPSDYPALYTASALSASLNHPLRFGPVAQGCFFVRRRSMLFSDCLAQYRQLCLSGSPLHALLPLFQMAFLFVSASCGLPWLAALAILAPELWALCHVRLLPGTLLRLSLLPLTAGISLDALLCRLFSRSKLLRLHVPESLLSPYGCMLCGAALLPAALYGAQALVALLPVSLLWLTAPLIIPALDTPTIERIPLDANQRSQLRSLSESAFFDNETTTSPPPMRMLSVCCGSMLGLLEPDEAARRIEGQLDLLSQDALSPFSFAAMLCAAQYLRRRMGDCDASLRKLPIRIEHTALSLPLEKPISKLSFFLAAARKELSSSEALNCFAKTDTPEPLDLLFLPLQSAKSTPVYPLSLPLTHPHTFLRRQLLDTDAPVFLPDPASRLLFLTAAALDHPFLILLAHSPVTGPYMPLLLI